MQGAAGLRSRKQPACEHASAGVPHLPLTSVSVRSSLAAARSDLKRPRLTLTWHDQRERIRLAPEMRRRPLVPISSYCASSNLCPAINPVAVVGTATTEPKTWPRGPGSGCGGGNTADPWARMVSARIVLGAELLASTAPRGSGGTAAAVQAPFRITPGGVVG